VRLLQQLGFHLWDHALEAVDAAGHLRLLDGLAEFREHLGGELTVTLLRDIGEGVEVHAMDPALVQRALLRLREQSRAV
jgi:3-dehydroquinate synthase